MKGNNCIMGNKNLLKKNIFIHDKCLSLKNCYYDKKIENITSYLSKIDSILDYDIFKEEMIRIRNYAYKKGKMLTVGKLGQESMLYGQLRNLCRYSNRDYNDIARLLLPCIEHGISWYNRPPAAITNPSIHSFVFQGNYNVDNVHKFKPFCPCYCIGPYIHYAQAIYSSKKMESLRNKFGKTALIFPFHCYEMSSAEYDVRKFVKEVISNLKDYNTIIVSAYWNDLDAPVYELFKTEGAIIVSSGFRGDPQFMDRQRTLFELSDASFGNGIGTHIGYSMYLNRQHYMFSSKINLFEEVKKLKPYEVDYYTSIENLFYDSFNFDKEYDGKIAQRNSLYEKFWGGEKYIKTPTEIDEMFEISIELLRLSKGFVSNYEHSIKKLISKFKSSDPIKYKLLLDSVSINI